MPVYLGDKKVSIFAGAGAAKLQKKTVSRPRASKP